ncbi:MAG: hypothetical protein AAB473_05365 [Patescibacteria group bacterium]
MARLKPHQKKNRAALAALGHTSVASAIAEIRRSMPSFDKRHNYPKVKGICPSLVDLVLWARGQKAFAFDHETGGFVSNNQRDREARSLSRSREDRFPKSGQPWHICE